MELSTAPALMTKPEGTARPQIQMANWTLLPMQAIGSEMKKGNLTKKFKHICWDGCMFPNEVMLKQQTWNDILGAMIQVREKHGWEEYE